MEKIGKTNPIKKMSKKLSMMMSKNNVKNTVKNTARPLAWMGVSATLLKLFHRPFVKSSCALEF
jgi:hypothetical protein